MKQRHVIAIWVSLAALQIPFVLLGIFGTKHHLSMQIINATQGCSVDETPVGSGRFFVECTLAFNRADRAIVVQLCYFVVGKKPSPTVGLIEVWLNPDTNEICPRHLSDEAYLVPYNYDASVYECSTSNPAYKIIAVVASVMCVICIFGAIRYGYCVPAESNDQTPLIPVQ